MLNTERTDDGVRVTRKGEFVALIKYSTNREGVGTWFVDMAKDKDYHGGINRNWYETLQGAEYAVYAAWLDKNHGVI